jgi:hypothetical protein
VLRAHEAADDALADTVVGMTLLANTMRPIAREQLLEPRLVAQDQVAAP